MMHYDKFIIYKIPRNFRELLLRQKFRQHFLDSPRSKIYGQHEKSWLQNLMCELDFSTLCEGGIFLGESWFFSYARLFSLQLYWNLLEIQKPTKLFEIVTQNAPPVITYLSTCGHISTLNCLEEQVKALWAPPPIHGVIHKPRGHIFRHFDLLPFVDNWLKKAYVVIWTFGKPSSPYRVHMVYEYTLFMNAYEHDFYYRH